MTSMILAGWLAMQASLPPAEVIMAKAVIKSEHDAQFIKNHYDVDVIKTPKDKKPRCKNPADSQMTIGELFGLDRYVYGFKFQLDKIQSLNGRPMYVIRFLPKNIQPQAPEGASTCSSLKNWSLNQLGGEVWIDAFDYGIAKVETDVVNPPARKYLVGTLSVLHVVMIQFKLEEVWAPLDITINSNYAKFLGFGEHTEHTRIEFRNYRPKR